jgi:hypothetical protein
MRALVTGSIILLALIAAIIVVDAVFGFGATVATLFGMIVLPFFAFAAREIGEMVLDGWS